MESIALLFTKFSSELISAQIALLCLAGAVSVYWMLVRARARHRNDWVPAALVKEYLDGVVRNERDVRYRLFGEEARVQMTASAAPVQQVVVQGADPAVMKELEALRAQLAVADQRALEFDRSVNALKTEKDALEKKLRETPAAASSGSGADPAVAAELAKVKKDADDLKAKLAEYEVIEDDLANLKKYQTENKTLREQLEALGKGASAPAAAPAAAPAPVAAAPEPAKVAPVAAAAPAPDATPAPVAAAPTPVAAAPAPEASAPAADAAPAAAAKPKEDELLSEFEKMLAS